MALLGAWATALANPCPSTADTHRFHGSGWGLDSANSRYQAADKVAIHADNVQRLELAWAFALDEGHSPHSYPAVSVDTVFVGTEDGNLYALARNSGCIRWRYAAGANIRTAIVPGTIVSGTSTLAALFFGTQTGTLHAVAATDGRELWQRRLDEHPFAMITGSPTFHDGRLFVPVSSYEVVVAAAPFYECCTFRGSVAAVDAASGELLWQTYTIDEPAAVTGRYWMIFDRYGPSGAPVWSAPTVDSARGQIYVGTGENYSDPPTPRSDAIVALDMANGRIRWQRQLLVHDTWNAGCALPLHPACPEQEGPDFDFGAPPLLTRGALGRELLLAGQKSGALYALDPDNGEPVWQTHVGRGGKLGGIHWGMAVDPERATLFVPVSDRADDSTDQPVSPAPGLHAFAVDSGQPRWHVPAEDTCGGRDDCFPGISAAVTATPDLVFAATLSGWVQAYSSTSGELLWRFDTWRKFPAVNGGEG